MSYTDFRAAQLNRTKLEYADGRTADFSHARFEADIKGIRSWITRYLWALITWQTIRHIGSLQVLTKVSYFMLALVPILAGAWQGVTLWVGQSRHDVSQALIQIDRSAQMRQLRIDDTTKQEAEHLRATIRRMQSILEQQKKLGLGGAPNEAAETLKELDLALEQFQKAVQSETAQDTQEIHRITAKLQEILKRDDLNPKMPTAWAIAFFAALFVALGHFVYQLRCPELVKEQTADRFAESVLNGYSSTSSNDEKDHLVRATNALKELAEVDPDNRHRNLVRRHGRTVWIPSELEYFELPEEPKENQLNDGNAKAPLPPIISAGAGLKRIAIEEGARAEYELKSQENRIGAVIAFGLYFVAGLLIGWLVASQSCGVLRAAGFLGT